MHSTGQQFSPDEHTTSRMNSAEVWGDLCDNVVQKMKPDDQEVRGDPRESFDGEIINEFIYEKQALRGSVRGVPHELRVLGTTKSKMKKRMKTKESNVDIQSFIQ
eukprot:12420275-Karenia_brevis.AAC.1